MQPRIVAEGKTISLADVSLTGNGVYTVDFLLHADTLLLSTFVRSVVGTVTVTCSTYTYTGEETDIITFPTVSAPTTELLLKKAAAALSNCRLKIVHTAACNLQVVGKGLKAGELSAKIVGAATASATAVNVTNTPTLVVAASLLDRAGILLKNTSSDTVYIGFTASEASVSTGYPLAANDTLSIDLSAGQAIYALKASAGTASIRLIEALN